MKRRVFGKTGACNLSSLQIGVACEVESFQEFGIDETGDFSGVS